VHYGATAPPSCFQIQKGRFSLVKRFADHRLSASKYNPNTNDSTILKAHIAGFVDNKGQLTQQGKKLMNFFSMKSTKVD